MANITLRSLHPEDLEKVVAIDAEIAGRSRNEFYNKRLQWALAAPETLITCAALDGEELIGFSFVRIEEGAFGINQKMAVVDALSVARNYRKGGVATLMLEELERRMAKNGIQQIRTLLDWSDTALTGFFSSAGFSLVPAFVLSRDCEVQPSFDGGDPEAERNEDGANNDYVALFRDTIPVRSMEEKDLSAIIRLDGKLSGADRSTFYRAKMEELLNDSGIRVSLVAEQDDAVVGFAMVRLDYGEFGQAEPSAVLDTIGVHPAYGEMGVGKALLSQLLGNLAVLQVNTVQTQVSWDDLALLNFMNSCGFEPTQTLVLQKALS